MSIERIRLALDLPLAMVDFAAWPTVPMEAVPANKRATFKRRLKACELYCAGGISARAVAKRVGMSHKQVVRVVRAALRLHEDGRIFGQRGLLPHLHIKSYERKATASDGTAGLFGQLLRKYPEVQAEIEDAYCNKARRLNVIHQAMLVSLMKRGVTAKEYPFNMQRLGAGALHAFCRRLHSERFRQIAFVRYGRDAGRRADHTDVREFVRHILRPYSRVEVDGHRIDAIFVLKIDGPDGVVRTVTLRRLMAIVLIDVASRAILGHALCLSPTESRTDIATAFERALSDAPPMAITEPGLSCRAGSGLPVHVVPNCAFRAMDELAFDNSLAASSLGLQTLLVEHLQARINIGEAGTPEGRAIVESFFKKLTENGYQRLPSTTGNSARSQKRRDPELKAHRYQLTLTAAEQILEVIVREYNNTRHGTLNCTPLQYIQDWDANGGLIRRLPKEAQRLSFLYEQAISLRVRGGVDSGTRPYVRYKGALYRNSLLSRRDTLVGTDICVVVDRRNIGLMRAFLPTGEPLGIVKAQGRWGLSPHSLKTRQAITKLEKGGKLTPVAADPLENYIAHLESQASSRRGAANELIRVRRERGELPPVRLAVTTPPRNTSQSRRQAQHSELTTPTDEDSTRDRRVNRAPPSELTLGMGIKIQRAGRRGV